MSSKRKDLKGRILHTGETQLKSGPSKGRYQYEYLDVAGNRCHAYSWRLVETDPTPAGRRIGPALRTLEEEIKQDLKDGINTQASRQTLNELFDRFINQKINLKETTKNLYIGTWNSHARDTIGNKEIGKVKYSDIKAFYIYLIEQLHLSYNTVDNYQRILNPIFEDAVRDDIIRKNPVRGVLNEVKKNTSGKEVKKIHALTRQEQVCFVSFLKEIPTYQILYRLTVVGLGTGMRLGEITGLTWDNIDFENNVIHVRQNLQLVIDKTGTKEKHSRYIIDTPKSDAGIRDIPLFDDVRQALEEMKQWDSFVDTGKTVDGYKGFCFLNSRGSILNPTSIVRKFKKAQDRYNMTEAKRAEEEGREPVLISYVRPHVLRHTFCSRLIEVTDELKVIQHIMGHRNITTTMNIYAELCAEKKKESYQELGIKLADLFANDSECGMDPVGE